MSKKIVVIQCPCCKKNTSYDLSNKFRPFCSEFCKNQDIIAWAEGRYRLPQKDKTTIESQDEMTTTTDS